MTDCSHSVQLHGLCALCGSDVSTIASNIKTVPITHDASGLVVSMEEAKRLDKETSKRLLKLKKLSLILDLDQTVLHATVDSKLVQSLLTTNSLTSGDGGNDHDDYHSNKSITKSDSDKLNKLDIHSFFLPDSSPDVKYFIKLRPGTVQFLHELNQIYEMHIYTMGSRHYAEAVAKVLDPSKTFFQDRILSRDDSGSFHVKSLERIFPCDQSMAVVVDDRGDVWRWSQNLIKVRPYNFFIGIGDINAPPTNCKPSTSSPLSDKLETTKITSSEPIASGLDEDTQNILDELMSLEDSLPKAPVKSMEEEEELKDDNKEEEEQQENNKLEKIKESRRPTLKDEDRELFVILDKLKELHKTFYEKQDSNKLEPTTSVQSILPSFKNKVLEGVVLTFSGVIPLGQDPRRNDLWNWAISFGAICSEELNDLVTHVVAVRKGTAKVNKAKNLPGVYVVHPGWVFDSISLWARLDEEHYLLEPYLSLPDIDQDDLKLLKNDDDALLHFGTANFDDMDKELEEFMGSDWSDSSGSNNHEKEHDHNDEKDNDEDEDGNEKNVEDASSITKRRRKVGFVEIPTQNDHRSNTNGLFSEKIKLSLTNDNNQTSTQLNGTSSITNNDHDDFNMDDIDEDLLKALDRELSEFIPDAISNDHNKLKRKTDDRSTMSANFIFSSLMDGDVDSSLQKEKKIKK